MDKEDEKPTPASPFLSSADIGLFDCLSLEKGKVSNDGTI